MHIVFNLLAVACMSLLFTLLGHSDVALIGLDGVCVDNNQSALQASISRPFDLEHTKEQEGKSVHAREIRGSRALIQSCSLIALPDSTHDCHIATSSALSSHAQAISLSRDALARSPNIFPVFPFIFL